MRDQTGTIARFPYAVRSVQSATPGDRLFGKFPLILRVCGALIHSQNVKVPMIGQTRLGSDD